MEDTGKCNRMTEKKNQSVAKSRPQHGKYPANLWETNKVTQKIITEVITSKDSSTSYWITGLVSFSQACANFIFKMPVYVYTQTNKKNQPLTALYMMYIYLMQHDSYKDNELNAGLRGWGSSTQCNTISCRQKKQKGTVTTGTLKSNDSSLKQQ